MTRAALRGILDGSRIGTDRTYRVIAGMNSEREDFADLLE